MNVVKTMKVNNYACENDISIPTSFIRSIGAKPGLNKIKIELNADKTLTIKVYDERAEKRKKWVDEMVARTQRWNTTFKFHKDTTIAAVIVGSSVNIGISRPAHGDEYDRRVGKAVAFAKAMGESIPNYI